MATSVRSGLLTMRFRIVRWLTRQYLADAPEAADVLEGPDYSASQTR
jgi:hypothetical protein